MGLDIKKKLCTQENMFSDLLEGIGSFGKYWDADRVGIRGWPTDKCCASWPLRCRPAERKEPEPFAIVSPVCDTWRGGSGTRPES